MPNLTDNLLIDTANQSAEALVNVGLEGLKIADKGVRAIDNAVSLRSLGGTFTKHLPKHKILDTSYGDIRSAGVEKVREWNKTAGFVADVAAPNVVDLAFGAGKITKGLKGIKHGISLTPDLLKMARNNVDNLLSPKLVTAGGPGIPSRLAISTAEQFTKANPLMIKGTEGLVTKAATSGKARRLSISQIPSESDDLISKLHPSATAKGDIQARKVLSGDNLTGDAAELKNLILEQDKLLKHAPTTILKDGRQVRVSSLSKPEIEALGVKIRNLKENLGLKSTSDYSNYTGAFVIDGYVARLDSKGKLVSTGQYAKRDLLERLWPASEDASRRTVSRAAGAGDKHHFRILDPSKIFGTVSDGKGGFKPRNTRQLEKVSKRLQTEDNIYLGNQDFNEIFQSRSAHLGAGGNRYGSHAAIRNLTDLQGRTLADADFLQVVMKKGDSTPTWVQQVKNKEGVITDFKLRNGDSIKPSQIKETVRYRLGGKTYDPKAMHGFSEEGIKLITGIKKDEDLYQAIKLYYEVSDEAYKGISGLASKITDAGLDVDKLTKDILKAHSPEVQTWIKHLLTKPEYKKDTRLLETLIRNTEDLLTLPGYKNNPKLQSLIKRVQTGLTSKTGLEKKLQINRK